MGEEELTDDYVADLLRQNAQKTAKQYEMVGLDAFLPTRSRSSAPKPNTRFLRHIIRETDSHNSALLAKEAEESRARLRRMGPGNDARRMDAGRLTPPELTDEENRPKKRKRAHCDEPEGRHRRRREERDHRPEKESRSKKDRYNGDDRRKERDRYHDGAEDSKHRYKPQREAQGRDHRRTHSGDEYVKSHKQEEARKNSTRRRQNSESPARSRSPTPRKHSKPSRRRHRSDSRDRFRERNRRHHSIDEADNSGYTERKYPESDSDSDPLEAIVGPLPPPTAPPVRTRGRGAHKANSNAMDARFSTAYDPLADVQLQSEAEDEWGDALEALKDRQRWRKLGAERLKAAGFSNDQVRKWEKGDEKTEEDVRWVLKGEGREWDRGKVLDEDGHVKLKAEWGRLT